MAFSLIKNVNHETRWTEHSIDFIVVLAGGAPEAVPFKVETRNFIFSNKCQ